MSKKPSNEKNSYENYVAHLNQISMEAYATYDRYTRISNPARLNLLGKTAAARIRFFDAFHDRYDVADELFGATIVPVALGLVGIASTLLAAWEAGHMLAIKAGLVRNDHEQHGDQAVMYFLAGVAASAFAFVTFFKSVVSLISRTGFTLLDGWKKPTKDRFHNKSVMSEVGTELLNVGGQLYDVVSGADAGNEADAESDSEDRKPHGRRNRWAVSS